MALGAEEARRQLAAAAIPDAEEVAARRARRVTGRPGQVVASLIDADLFDGAGRPLTDEQIGAWLDGATERQRRKVWRALHPQLAPVLEHWWAQAVADPYPEGYARRAFRAPRHPELSWGARVQTLRAITWMTSSYDRPIAWFAAWAAHLGNYGGEIGRLLAVALDAGDPEVRATLHATIRGEHPVGQVGRDLVTALLASSDPDDWAAVERLLLAAQRQEGLRSVILEAVDLAHPGAFRQLLRVVHREGLTRFAAVIRAVGVWFGTSLDVRDRSDVDALLADAIWLLDDPAAREAAITGVDPARVHLALWCLAFDDAPAAVDRAGPLLASPSADHRLVAARLLFESQLVQARRLLLPALRDRDLRVAAVAVQAIEHDHELRAGELGEAVRALLARLPGRVDVDVGVLRPEPVVLDPADLADALVHRTDARDVLTLDDVLDRVSADGRDAYARLLAEDPQRHRDRLLGLLGDRSGHVRDTVLEALEVAAPPTPDDAPHLESLLTRRSAPLRRGVLSLLLRQDDAAALASVDRLRTGTAPQRTAGAELLRELVAAGRGGPTANARAEALAGDASQSAEERRLITSVVEAADPPPELIDHAARTVAVAPAGGDLDLGDLRTGTDLVLTSLDAWLLEHRDREVPIRRWDGDPLVMVLGDLSYLAPPDGAAPWRDQQQEVPLADLVDPWLERTLPQLTAGGAELAAALAAVHAVDHLHDPYAANHWGPERSADAPSWLVRATSRLVAPEVIDGLTALPVAASLLRWFAVREARTSWLDPLLDLAEAAAASVPDRARRELPTVARLLAWEWGDPPLPRDWRAGAPVAFLEVLLALETVRPELFTPRHRGRLWRLLRFVDEPFGTWTPADGHDELDPDARRFSDGATSTVPRRPARRLPTTGLCVRSIEDGVADRADLLDLLVGPRVEVDGEQASVLRSYDIGTPLSMLTRRRPERMLQEHPWVAEIVDEVRDRIVATEAARGELPTPVSAAARQLRSVRGTAEAVGLLVALGGAKLVRRWSWGTDLSRPEVLSHLLQVSFPAPDETPATFARLAREAGLSERRILELAVYAPQWAPAAEHTLGWPGLAEAIHWIHAHTKDDR